jgi:membrane peptidoglycan carboxypeptidase
MAMVAVDPKTGRIITSNGYQPEKPGFDHARAWQNPGGLFMAFDLVALLHKGKGLGEVYDGTSRRKFGSSMISNAGDAAPCGRHCSVAKAMELSVNTVLADIAYNEVGLKAVARAAVEAGIPQNVGIKKIPIEGTDESPPNINIAIGGDVYQARPVDIAGAYATFAANGTKRAPHLVAKVTESATKSVLLDNDSAHAGGTPAFDSSDAEANAKVARNVTEALLPGVSCADGRPCAGKPALHGCADVPGKSKRTD